MTVSTNTNNGKAIGVLSQVTNSFVTTQVEGKGEPLQGLSAGVSPNPQKIVGKKPQVGADAKKKWMRRI